ncbi:hypothetical protein U9M48_004562 [Paspalum notatum var. saurae]|uniref:DUF659 domain-containing protein n=1 Tax=Paspalum notatum var. saurae TaxID=547442 RepID=A0AAQ3PTJ3_PASNO
MRRGMMRGHRVLAQKPDVMAQTVAMLDLSQESEGVGSIGVLVVMERDSGYATKGKGKQLAVGEPSSAGWEWVVAVNGPIDDAWSHGEKWKSQGWKCGYCPAARDSGDATGHKQNAEFIFDCIEEVIVTDVGLEWVVQIVTDNGANYKKACEDLVSLYDHITWQPCAAHTINLMLKDIACFDEVGELLYSAKRMCRFLYKHNRLHAMMKDKIGGELIRWNATRFGTLFLFLQSFLDRQEKFQSWMVFSDWKNNEWRDEDDHKFTYDCLTDRIWWNKVELVLKAVTTLYSVFRFVDQDKNGTICGFVPRMLHAQSEIFAKLKHDKNASRDIINRLNEVINKRTRYLVNGTLMSAGAGLDPYALYASKLVKNPSVVLAVTMAIKKLASSPSEASMAIDQFTKTFSKQEKLFASLEARSSALRRETSPAEWWNSYGGQCKELQKIAIRIVSQCSSSSGCERNWSTFALQFEGESDKKEIDPCSMMMDLALFDDNNPIMDWFSNSRAESTPILDEYDDDDDDWTTPGGFLISELEMNDSEVSAFKRDLQFGKNKKRKLQMEEEEFLEDDYESDSHGNDSPVYAESEDSSSNDEGNDDNVVAGDRSGGGDVEGGKSGGGGAGCSGGRAPGGASHALGVRLQKQTILRPRSSRKKKPTLKSLDQL